MVTQNILQSAPSRGYRLHPQTVNPTYSTVSLEEQETDE